MDPDFWLAHWTDGAPAAAQRFHTLNARDVLPLVRTQVPMRFTDYESLENRVYGFGPHDEPGPIIKMYRPGRWSHAALQDEVTFIEELAAAGLAVLVPQPLADGGRIGTWHGIHYVVLDRVIGDRSTMEDRTELRADEVRDLGERVAQLHDVGEMRDAPHRPRWTPASVLGGNLRFLESTGAVPKSVQQPFRERVEALIEVCANRFAGVPLLRIHGDLGMNNLLWPGPEPVFMDFDDTMVGPAMQDLLTLDWGYTVAGQPDTTPVRLGPSADDAAFDAHYAARAKVRQLLIEGYRRRRALPDEAAELVEPLMLMRVMGFTAWHWARRDDPHFPDVRERMASVEDWQRRLDDLTRRLQRLTRAPSG
ncbi:MAG: phosphotransferase [Myxococcota bacterium]